MSINSEICKARSMFMTRGILNREIVPDVIVYSWVRSKLHNISFELLNVKKSHNSIDILSLDILSSSIIKYLRTVSSEDSMIYVINNLGDVIYNNNLNNSDLPIFSNLSEETIGTNAAGISLISGESLTVNGCEHYNKILTNYISTSLVLENNVTGKNIIIAIFTPNRLRSSHDRLHNVLTDHFDKDDNEMDHLSTNAEKELNDQANLSMDEKVESDFEEPSSEMSNDPGPSLVDYKTLLEESKNDNIGNPIKNKVSVNTQKSIDETPDVKDVEKCDEYSVLRACKVFTLSVVEAQTIREALDYYNWNLKKTSEALGIGRSTLYRKLKEYQIEK